MPCPQSCWDGSCSLRNREIQIDTVNLTVPSGDNQVNSFGFGVYNAVDSGDAVYSSAQVIHTQYDTDPSDGYQWAPYGSFGINGSGGSNGNANWGLGASDVLYIYAYGYSARMRVEAGKMWGDNFLVTGGVPVP